MSGFHHPFFKPMWRRVVTVAALLGWAIFELNYAEPLWGIVFGGLGLLAAWQFFITWRD